MWAFLCVLGGHNKKPSVWRVIYVKTVGITPLTSATMPPITAWAAVVSFILFLIRKNLPLILSRVFGSFELIISSYSLLKGPGTPFYSLMDNINNRGKLQYATGSAVQKKKSIPITFLYLYICRAKSFGRQQGICEHDFWYSNANHASRHHQIGRIQ